MIRRAFVLQLRPCSEAEYQRRHRAIWPELEAALKAHGVHNYSIFVHPDGRQLFGYLELESEERWQALARTEVQQRWRRHMADLLECHFDYAPKATRLREVFHLP